MGRSRDAAIQGLRDRTANAAETASPVRGSLESGQAIQSGIRGFRDGFKAKQGDLYARLDEHIDPMAPVDVTRTRQTLAALNEDIPGAPELSKQFKNGRIGEIERALLSDSGQIPTGTPTVTTRQILGATPQQTGVDIMGRPSFRGSPQGQFTIPGRTVEGGTPEVPYSVDLMGRRTPLVEPKPNTVNLPARTVRTFGSSPMTVDVMGRVVPAAPVIGFEQTVAAPRMTSTFSGLGVTSTPPTTLPFQAVRKTRTLVGNEIADTNLTSSVPRSKWTIVASYALSFDAVKRHVNAMWSVSRAHARLRGPKWAFRSCPSRVFRAREAERVSFPETTPLSVRSAPVTSCDRRFARHLD